VGQALMQGDAASAPPTSPCNSPAIFHAPLLHRAAARRPRTTTSVHVAGRGATGGAPEAAGGGHAPGAVFAPEDDYEAHEARVCIADGEILGNRRRVRRFTREQYFKSAERDGRRCLPMCPRRIGQYAWKSPGVAT
jgi:DNA polymerase-3 subunit alpha